MKSDRSIRKPAVAGMFYPAQPDKLREQINNLVRSEKDKIRSELSNVDIIGGVVPHAGYEYSGYEAIHFFELVRLSGKVYDTIVILNPDHQGFSPEFATSPDDYWETPLGLVELDKSMAGFFPKSELAHSKEHSAEVMLPFIQLLLDQKVKILPISIGNPTPDTAKNLANKIIESAREANRKILIIASSDFSHYVTPQEGRMQDDLALDRICALDSLGFYQIVRKKGISLCGLGPIMTLIEYSLLSTESPKVGIAARGNSGKDSPSKAVVDYITIIFSS